VNSYLLESIWERKHLLDQTEEDDLKVIQPLVFALNLSPQELKAGFGKGLWKRLCAESYTRNRYIGRLLSSGIGRRIAGTKQPRLERASEAVQIMLSMPSKYLKRGLKAPLKIDKVGEMYCRLERAGEVQRLNSTLADRDVVVNPAGPCPLDIIIDTRRMCFSLGEEFNYSWSMKKVREKHEEYSRRKDQERFSPKPFSWVEDPWVVKSQEILHEGVEHRLTLLDNAYALKGEGREMKHCVGSYASGCADLTYIIYAVERNGEKYSTLSFLAEVDEQDKILRVSVGQHYERQNRRVDTTARAVAEELKATLNNSIREWRDGNAQSKGNK
jgi:hypothetical protein